MKRVTLLILTFSPFFYGSYAATLEEIAGRYLTNFRNGSTMEVVIESNGKFTSTFDVAAHIKEGFSEEELEEYQDEGLPWIWTGLAIVLDDEGHRDLRMQWVYEKKHGESFIPVRNSDGYFMVSYDIDRVENLSRIPVSIRAPGLNISGREATLERQ